MIGEYCQVGDLMHIPQGTNMSELLTDGTFARFGYTKNPCKGILLGHRHGDLLTHKRLLWARTIYFAKIRG